MEADVLNMAFQQCHMQALMYESESSKSEHARSTCVRARRDKLDSQVLRQQHAHSFAKANMAITIAKKEAAAADAAVSAVAKVSLLCECMLDKRLFPDYYY